MLPDIQDAFFFNVPVQPPASSPPKSKRNIVVIGVVAGILLLLFLAYFLGTRSVATFQSSSLSQTQIAKPSFTKTLNKNYQFPVTDGQGNEVTKITYTIQSIQLQNEIILQGQKADAVAGRTFLIINLKITNPSSQSIQINSRDFIRISVDNSSDLLAPNIHNDPITLQPISTDYTRLGLPVNVTIKKVKLTVGQISGPKQTIAIPITK